MAPENVQLVVSGYSREARDTALCILESHHLVLVRLQGSTDPEQAAAVTEALFAHPAYRPNCRGIVDLRCGQLNFTAEDIECYATDLLAREASGGGRPRWAIVAHDPVDTALAYILRKRLRRQLDIGVFYLLENAVKWLELPWPEQAVVAFLGEDRY